LGLSRIGETCESSLGKGPERGDLRLPAEIWARAGRRHVEREKGIYTLGRSSDKYAAPRFSTFPLNSTAPMKIQPSVVNRKGINLAPWWGQSCLHWSVPTPWSCRRPRLEDHNHESKAERRERRQMMKKTTRRETRERNEKR
jgi:hypothetical protein